MKDESDLEVRAREAKLNLGCGEGEGNLLEGRDIHKSVLKSKGSINEVNQISQVDDPRVVLIMLADRLHNSSDFNFTVTSLVHWLVKVLERRFTTLFNKLFTHCNALTYSLHSLAFSYALPSGKAKAVAQDTLVIWCSLASRLGHWALKAELEDLCFAVLQTPSSSSSRVGNLRRLSAKSSSNPEYEASTEDVVVSLKAVIPFDLLLDRRKRIKYIQDLGSCSEVQTKPKVVRDAGIALASLVVCEEELERELFISTSYVPGMEVTLSSRLKSLYSIYSKVNRKDVSIDKVYDACALRVIIGDKSGTLHGQAVECCYSLLNIIHKLWTPINGELDDYIVNPKSGGYQSMHEYFEHGVAAHWLYKEASNKLPVKSNVIGSEITSSSYLSNEIEDKSPVEDDVFHKYRSLKLGDLVLRVEGSHLFAAVIVRDLLVAASFVLAASEAVADRRSSSQRKWWEAYARLYKKVDINVSPYVVVRVLQRGGGGGMNSDVNVSPGVVAVSVLVILLIR
uniref:RelA/SpoT domain-containing protein n=1 Tax=Lactuca sativa TaxID=4236 RepID=A0A9R1WU95_LACSA|nr:hypothetical protein LSAT_V11C900503990 [Lactuca sativa]